MPLAECAEDVEQQRDGFRRRCERLVETEGHQRLVRVPGRGRDRIGRIERPEGILCFPEIRRGFIHRDGDMLAEKFPNRRCRAPHFLAAQSGVTIHIEVRDDALERKNIAGEADFEMVGEDADARVARVGRVRVRRCGERKCEHKHKHRSTSLQKAARKKAADSSAPTAQPMPAWGIAPGLVLQRCGGLKARPISAGRRDGSGFQPSHFIAPATWGVTPGWFETGPLALGDDADWNGAPHTQTTTHFALRVIHIGEAHTSSPFFCSPRT